MNSQRKELLSERITVGRRTYFFDVKETAEGAKYLVISESKLVGEAHEHNRVMVFEEDVAKFNSTLQKAVRFILKQPRGGAT